jgi:hypothetical protein
MRSLGVLEGQGKRPVDGRDARLRKIDNFLRNRAGHGIVFQKVDKPGSHFLRGDAPPDFGIETGSDSEMAQQAIEIAQNGLAIRRPAIACGGEPIRRVPYDFNQHCGI